MNQMISMCHKHEKPLKTTSMLPFQHVSGELFFFQCVVEISPRDCADTWSLLGAICPFANNSDPLFMGSSNWEGSWRSSDLAQRLLSGPASGHTTQPVGSPLLISLGFACAVPLPAPN